MFPIADVSGHSIAELVSLVGRSAVVTGGGQGLGKAIAKRLAEAGANVLIGDVDGERASAAAADLAEVGQAKVVATFMDVADSASILAAVETARGEFGGIDIWVNNAGIFPSVDALSLDDALWDKVFAINTRGLFVGSREAARSMNASGRGGVIVNIASKAALGGVAPGLAAYVASKHAVLGITRQMAMELAPMGIRVLGIAPSFMVTEGNLALMQQNPDLTQAGEDIPSMLNSRLGRVGVADDIARVALFCASDMSIFMSGAMLPVDAADCG